MVLLEMNILQYIKKVEIMSKNRFIKRKQLIGKLKEFIKICFMDKFLISKNQDKLIKNIYKDLNKYLKNKKLKPSIKILHIPSFYHVLFTRITDIYILMALKLRGAEIVSVLTENFYKDEDVVYGGIYNENRKELIKDYDKIEKGILKNLLNIKCEHLEKHLLLKDHFEAERIAAELNLDNYRTYKYKNYEIGQQCSVITCNMNNMPEMINKPEYIRQFKMHAYNIIRLLNVYERIFNKVKPDVVLSNIPFYYKWGVPFSIAKNYDIPFYSAKLGEKKNSIAFTKDTDIMFDSSPAWESFKNQKLDEKTNKFIEEYIAKRIKNEVSYHFSYLKMNKNSLEFQDFFKKIDKNKPIIFFPSNIVFDAAVFVKNSIFESPIDMIKNVIIFFNMNPQYQLIIKAHPAESTVYRENIEFTKYRLKNIIKNLELKLNNNITFLDYDTKISTYDIIPIINIGITYTSSTEMEMAWSGKPVIACASCHNSNKGFTYEPNSIDEFFSLIQQLISREQTEEEIKQRIDLSKKYYLLYYYHTLVNFEAFQGNESDSVEQCFKIQSYEEMLPGKNPALDYICDKILSKQPIYGDNIWPPLTL